MKNETAKEVVEIINEVKVWHENEKAKEVVEIINEVKVWHEK